MPRRDWWPLTRLLIVCGVLGATRLPISWALRHPRRFWAGVQGVGTSIAGVALVSAELAQLALLAGLFLLCLLVLLNDVYYDVPRWVLDSLLGPRHRMPVAMFALGFEMGLFYGTARLFGSVVSRLLG